MKIKIFVGELKVGGAENQAVSFAQYLSERKYDIELISIYSGGQYWDYAKQCGLKISSLYSKKSKFLVVRIINLILAPFKLRAKLKNNNTDFLCSYSDFCNLLAFFSRLFIKKIKLIWMIRRSDFQGLKSSDWKIFIIEKVCGYYSSQVDIIVFNSNRGREYYTATFNFNGAKTVVLHNSVDADKFKKSKALEQEVSVVDFGLNKDAIIVGVFGRIIKKHKGHSVFIKAFALLKADYPELQALIVGPSEEKTLAELKDLVRKLNVEHDVIFLGPQDKMERMYNVIDILCSPSLSEGTSNVILEAMASEVPCVVTDVGDSKYIVGEHNIVVPPADYYSLYQGMKKMMAMQNSWVEIGALNRAHMQNKFSKANLFDIVDVLLCQ